MKIISRYVLREHVGPFLYALTALTSLLLLNFISRNFGELVGKGLPSSAIAEFFVLSIPFTVALTLPMSVLVAVLYAFSRLAAENEVTALKASGVSPWRLVTPSIVAGVFMSLFLLAFNDQVLPRANHQLKTLQDDIAQTKPTFLLNPQVINAVSEGKLYLKAGRIEQTGNPQKLHEVVIYDLADPTRRRTIHADSGTIAFSPNRKDLELDLFTGEMKEVATEKPSQLNRLFFNRDRIRVKDVAEGFSQTKSDSSSRGERELGVCAMQLRLHSAQGLYFHAVREYEFAVKTSRLAPLADGSLPTGPPPHPGGIPEPRGIGWAYCQVLSRVFGVKKAHAAEPGAALARVSGGWQDTTPKAVRDSLARKAAQDSVAMEAMRRAAQGAAAAQAPGQAPLILGATPVPGAAGAPQVVPPAVVPPAAAAPVPDPNADTGNSAALRSAAAAIASNQATFISRTAEAKLRLDIAEHQRNRYLIEIHKKFSLAAACLIFVILGAPIALRFPRGGVGLVLGVSMMVFALYYVGLIGGEAMANKGLVPPFWAMWGTNVILTLIGIVLLFRMDRESNTGRGGDWGDRMDRLRETLRVRRAGKPTKAAA